MLTPVLMLSVVESVTDFIILLSWFGEFGKYLQLTTRLWQNTILLCHTLLLCTTLLTNCKNHGWGPYFTIFCVQVVAMCFSSEVLCCQWSVIIPERARTNASKKGGLLVFIYCERQLAVNKAKHSLRKSSLDRCRTAFENTNIAVWKYNSFSTF